MLEGDAAGWAGTGVVAGAGDGCGTTVGVGLGVGFGEVCDGLGAGFAEVSGECDGVTVRVGRVSAAWRTGTGADERFIVVTATAPATMTAAAAAPTASSCLRRAPPARRCLPSPDGSRSGASLSPVTNRT